MIAPNCPSPSPSRLIGIDVLRGKESDRVEAIRDVLTRAGASVEVRGNEMIIRGVANKRNAEYWTHSDHRVALMAWVLATALGGCVMGVEAIAKSWPSALNLFEPHASS